MPRRLVVALIVMIGCCLQTRGQSSANFCSSHAGTLYCLTPNLYANPNPDPFTAVLSTLGSQLGLVPLASPASGIIYTLDPRVGVPVASGTETFGPVLVDRGETLGAHKLFLAFTYQHFSFSSIDSVNLNKIPILFTACETTYGTCGPIATKNRIDPKINQYAVFGTFGITSRIDVSVAVPINNARLGIAGLSCTPPYCSTPEAFSPSGGNGALVQFTSKSLRGTAMGVGDIVFRGKFQIFRGEKIRFAAGTDVRIPSGDALNFLGTGATGVKPFAAISRSGRFAPHVNVAYQWNGSSIIGGSTPGTRANLPSNFFYDIGADVGATKRITVAGDILGEYVHQALRLQPASITPIATSLVPTPVPVTTVGISSGSFPTLQASGGLKYKPFKQLLISGNALFSLSHNGLRNEPVPLIGASYTF